MRGDIFAIDWAGPLDNATPVIRGAAARGAVFVVAVLGFLAGFALVRRLSSHRAA